MAERRVARVSVDDAVKLIRQARSRPDGRHGNLGWFLDNRAGIDKILVVPTSIYRLASGRVLCALVAVLNKRTFTTYVDVGPFRMLTLRRARRKDLAELLELSAAQGQILKNDEAEDS
jgi:hypothetical protein